MTSHPQLRRVRFASHADVAAFEQIPLDERLGGRDLVALFAGQVAAAPSAPAIQYLPGGVSDISTVPVTRRDLLDGARGIAAELRRLGAGPTDVVASLLPNGPGTVCAALAALAVATLAPINYYLEPSQILKLIAECGAKVILVPRDKPSILAAAFDSILSAKLDAHILEIDPATASFGQFGTVDFATRAPHERVALFHTGGTTGLPKFVPLTARNLAAGALISGFGYGYAADDNVSCAMPMFHVGGLFACALFPLCAGSTVTVLGPLGYRGDGVVAALPQTIATCGITVAVGPPTIMAQLATNPPDRTKADRLRLLVNGAAALPHLIGERLSAASGVPVVEPWGLTEATLAVTSGPFDGQGRQGSVGLSLPYCEVKAIRTDADGKAIGDCDVDEIGTLAVHGPTVFNGYWNRPAESQPFFPGRWLDTGDLGRVDPEGYIWVTGRAKELIKRGGHGIDPATIEDALIAHEAVALAAAVGKPDAYAGELPVAYVQLHPGATADPRTILAFAAARIPERAAVPKDVFILPRLPITAVGKVHKQPLKADIIARAVRDLLAQTLELQEVTVTVEPDQRHGLVARVRVPAECESAARDALGTLPIKSTINSLDGAIRE
ncbi:AMP-binding protein [Rhodopseudomonas sp. HC1]|uniref:AMP-binding protein n=1 Tax=Rhodopseudomonas infernalis TaxID=2897386 RepID=UPI001EE96C5F|nr:AMP-binding protein [Rhodopseudomonas infernalis]MCG6203760.1 AMP-binding protein [Rhodopseudomonas infernalis]